MTTFHVRLKELKDSSELTQAKIAEMIDLTPQAFSYIMNGREPNFDVLVKIAKAFDVSTDWLMGLTNVRSTDFKIKALSEYTGIDESVLNNLAEINSSPINANQRYMSFFSKILGSSNFFLMSVQLLSYFHAVTARIIYEKIWDDTFLASDDEPFSLDYCEKNNLEDAFRQKIERVNCNSSIDTAIKEKLKAVVQVWGGIGSDAISAQIVEEFDFAIEEIDSYVAEKRFNALTSEIEEMADEKAKQLFESDSSI